jgi:hypothetical protein
VVGASRKAARKCLRISSVFSATAVNDTTQDENDAGLRAAISAWE